MTSNQLYSIDDQEFEKLITKAMDELPQKYIEGLDNVAITYEDEPTAGQINSMRVDHNHLLLGLYEGIPRTERGAGYNLVLPDKITLFKNPILAVSSSHQMLFEQIKRTLWHEIAHHYGLNHDRMDEIQGRAKSE